MKHVGEYIAISRLKRSQKFLIFSQKTQCFQSQLFLYLPRKIFMKRFPLASQAFHRKGYLNSKF